VNCGWRGDHDHDHDRDRDLNEMNVQDCKLLSHAFVRESEPGFRD
jgi:hypothetical protein